MTQDDRSCFIIMPITTPESAVDHYRDGAAHFSHVLECLFIPAVEQAGYKAIPPIAEGADLIQANIIENLETADLVLCDMSCLNPNVFFEFGIRTSLNKPVCVVKDEQTKKVPFDTAIINHQEYESSLEPWLLNQEIKRLAKHVRASFDRSDGENTLWKYFGFRSEAKRFQGDLGDESKLDYMTLQLDSLREKVDRIAQQPYTEPLDSLNARRRGAFQFLVDNFPDNSLRVVGSIAGQTRIVCEYDGLISSQSVESVSRVVRAQYSLDLRMQPKRDTD